MYGRRHCNVRCRKYIFDVWTLDAGENRAPTVTSVAKTVQENYLFVEMRDLSIKAATLRLV